MEFIINIHVSLAVSELRLPGICNIQMKMGFAPNYMFIILLDLGFALYHPHFFNSTYIGNIQI